MSTAGSSFASASAHHVIAVSQYLDPLLTFLASAGVFAGALIWSWLYMRYRSIWPGWLSHVLADIAVFGIGWYLLFGMV
jgi:membrane protease YdiL (CAAX protease family)